MIVTVTNGVVRDGMTSRRGIIAPFYEIAVVRMSGAPLHTVPVAQRLGVRLGGVRARSIGKAIDHAAQVAIADRFAMFREINHRAIHEIELGAGQAEAERFAPALHGVTSRMP